MITWFGHTLRGVCMGVADAIPGVSGGTLALILGIYEHFIAAISAIGPGMVRAMFSKVFWQRLVAGLKSPGAQGDDTVGTYAGHVLFLGFLGLGIVGAFLVGAKVIPELLTHYPSQMNGFFFGLVLASVVIPFKMMKTQGPLQIGLFLAFAAATFFLVNQPIDQSAKSRGVVVVTLPAPAASDIVLTPVKEQTAFLTDRHGGDNIKREVAFLPRTPMTIAKGDTSAEVSVVARLAGKVANLEAGALTNPLGLPEGTTITQASAMSGGSDPALWFIFIAGVIAISAMVLPGISGSFILLMLGLYNYIFFNVRAFVYDGQTESLTILVVFGLALVLGILTFARVVNWMLQHYRDATLAALVGLMIGSLRKLWPFSDYTADGQVEAILPNNADGTLIATVGMFVAGIALIIVLERLGTKRSAGAQA